MTGRFIQGQGKIPPQEAPFRIILPLFGLGLGSSRCAEVLQCSSDVMDQSVQGPPLQIDLAALQQIIHLAASTLDLDVVRKHDFQIQCGRSQVDDVLQSCQINSGKLRRHVRFQSQKHMPWPLQGQRHSFVFLSSSPMTAIGCPQPMVLQASTCEPHALSAVGSFGFQAVGFCPLWPDMVRVCKTKHLRGESQPWKTKQFCAKSHKTAWAPLLTFTTKILCFAHPPHFWPQGAQAQLWRLV